MVIKKPKIPFTTVKKGRRGSVWVIELYNENTGVWGFYSRETTRKEARRYKKIMQFRGYKVQIVQYKRSGIVC